MGDLDVLRSAGQSSRGFRPAPAPFPAPPGRKKKRTTRTGQPLAYRPTHPHTRRYNPDVQDVEYIQDVQK
jgi:hypothetical protein